MKICWDNLEKLKYRYDRGEWQYKKHFYIYKVSCQTCGEPFLAFKNTKGYFCDKSCATSGKFHHMYGKKLSEETKKKISEGRHGQSHPNWKGGVVRKNIPLFDTYAPQIDYCEKVRRDKEDINILEVKCAYCGKWYIPKMNDISNRIQAIKGEYSGEARLYCSTQCKQECPIYHKQKWPKGFKPATSREVQPELRQMCFERDGFICQKCGKHQNELDVGLQCHHIEGIRWEPLESADLDKVITFCKNCHIEVHKQPDCGYQDLKCKGGNG